MFPKLMPRGTHFELTETRRRAGVKGTVRYLVDKLKRFEIW